MKSTQKRYHHFEDQRFNRLLHIVSELERGNAKTAKLQLDDWPKLQFRESSEDLKYHLFLMALGKRLGDLQRAHETNLYLLDFETKQIDLFDLMGRKMPLVAAASSVANALLASLLMDPETTTVNPVLIDIGMGTGRQEMALLELLATFGQRAPKRMIIIGLEPDEQSLNQAQTKLLAKAREIGISLEFIPICKRVEELKPEDWKWLKVFGKNAVINEAFALHHVPSHDGIKDFIIERLRALNPAAFILSEPDSDHETSSLSQRFQNAWKHFGLVFSVIDLLDIHFNEKSAMKVQFFAREIEDILGTPEDLRTERHETAEMWLARLKRAGFSPMNHEKLKTAATAVSQYPLIKSTTHPEHLSLDFINEPIVSVLAVE